MKIIYEKKYPPEEDDGNEELLTTEKVLDAFLDAHSRLTFRYLPERKKGRSDFICKAAEFAQEHRYDIKVVEEKYFVEARLSFDHQYNLGSFTKLIGMADDITIYWDVEDRFFTVSLLYYTYAVLYDGEQVVPVPPEY